MHITYMFLFNFLCNTVTVPLARKGVLATRMRGMDRGVLVCMNIYIPTKWCIHLSR